MSHKHSLDDCHSGHDFVKYATQHPECRSVRQSGSHVIVEGPLPGRAVLPDHRGDAPTGTRHSMIKMLIAIGLGMVACVVMAMGPQQVAAALGVVP